jgi:uncharacterized protein YecE (DUF72 family)
MDFGRLPNINNVDFSLPPTPPQTQKVLLAAPKGKKAQIYIGCPVWGEKEWVGKLYPKGTKPKEFLHYYSTQFNSIELNGTHYNFPNEILVEKWKADVLPHFKFCPKLTQNISHFQRLVGVEGMVDEFCRAIRLLETNLGTCFLQLPPNFTPKNIDAVLHFVEYWPKDVPLAVEFRHPAWFADGAVWNEITAALQYHKIGTVITDVAGRRDAAHQRLTTPETFVRFGANDLHPTDYPRLDAWANLLHQWIQNGLQTAWFFLHTPEKHYNLELATYMVNALNQKGYTLKAPYPYTEPPKPKPQTSLF